MYDNDGKKIGSTFDKDVDDSLNRQRVSNILSKWNYETIAESDGNDKRYDIIVKKKKKVLAIELKQDRECRKTYNVAIEYRCNGVASGLTATESDYYIITAHVDEVKRAYFLISVKRLRKLMSGDDYMSVRGGDGNRAEMYLFPLSELRKYGKLIYKSKIMVR